MTCLYSKFALFMVPAALTVAGCDQSDPMPEPATPTAPDQGGAGVESDASDPGLPVEDPDTSDEPGRFQMTDLEYAGAFRLSSDDFGDSNVNYAVGTLGYNPDRHSLFVAGHAQHNAVAEFAIPQELGMGDLVEDLPVVEQPLQPFQRLLGRSDNGNPDGMDRVTGLYWNDGHLIVQANSWYDADGGASDTTLLVVDGELDGSVVGYFELEGAARSAGFVSPIPTEWQSRLGGPALAGWASNYSIVSRYSVGPTLFAFDPSHVTANAGDPSAHGPIAARGWLDYPYAGGELLAPDALDYQCSMDDDVTNCDEGATGSGLWNYLSQAMYGFIIPGTRTYALFGSTGGTRTGIGYKIVRDDGSLCGGPCAHGADDYDNYYWLFDLEEILAADSPSAPQPYDYGAWDVPFDDQGSHRIIGGAWDPTEGVLYLSLGGAGQVGTYDRPPLIVAHRLVP